MEEEDSDHTGCGGKREMFGKQAAGESSEGEGGEGGGERRGENCQNTVRRKIHVMNIILTFKVGIQIFA